MGPFCLLWMATLLLLCGATRYTNDWAVRIRADPQSVDRIAQKYGFTNMGQIGDLKHYYSFRHRGTTSWAAESEQDVTGAVAQEPEVDWLQRQAVHRRAARSQSDAPVYSTDTKTKWRPAAAAQHRPSGRILHSSDSVNSPWFNRCNHKPCMNIAEAWGRGYTGKDVVVSVLDDGIDEEHPDLKPNYDHLASCDAIGRDGSPTDHPDKASNYHGTQCAGTVAAAANNCTVGVSFQARIGGIRLLGGDVTDVVEARSLSFKPQYVDVYLASWGPEDDGSTLEGPGPLALLALENGIKTGRQGRGSVYVWASGNGGQRGDHCSADGYASSIYTISVSSARGGGPPGYLERCASTLTTAYSGSDTQEVTPGPNGGCTRPLPGSSLSASVAAGVIALTLQANPSLTWRDVQHIIVRTSNARHLAASDWQRNGAGYRVSHLYGFGLLDAEAMVKEAERWSPVPSQQQCAEEATVLLGRRTIRPSSPLTSVHKSAGCYAEGQQRQQQQQRQRQRQQQRQRQRPSVVYVEHVVVRVTIAHSRRGDLSIALTSPQGTVSQLLANRPHDNSSEGFQDWPLMTTHCWGERAAGEWTLRIQDTPSPGRDVSQQGQLKRWSLLIYGTAEPPYAAHHQRARSAEMTLADDDLTEEDSGPCDPECSDDGCEGPGPQHCVTCLHFFLKFKNNTRMCVSECPRGFWGDRRRCKRCYSSCDSCTGSRSDQCTSCQAGHHLTEDANTCTVTCGDGYYLDHDANMCRKCRESCLKCTSYSICTECKPDTSLQGNRCQQSCLARFYHDEQTAACKPCHEACATCAGAGVEACKECAQGYLMEGWKCVSACSAGFYAAEPGLEIADGHRICRRCDARCLTCTGPSGGNCSSCSSGHSLQEGACVVNSQCTDGQYHDSDGTCHTCDPTCLTCTGPHSQDCVSCSPSRTLDEGRCVTDCSKGKYQSGGQCHLCDHTCSTCVDAGPASCTSCENDKFGMERYLYEGQCVTACPEAFYHTQERSCQRCSDHCRLCTSATHCLKCNSSYYVSEGSCVRLECGEGEVEDPDYDDCMACEEGCRKCVLYNPRHCLSCTEGFYNFQDGCYKNCPAKTYSVEEEMSCVPCDDKCVSCDQHECYWCETDLFLSEGTCVSVCPDGSYGDDDTNDCEECHPSCETCSGPDEDDCLSCTEGLTLGVGVGVGGGSKCLSQPEVCPVRTFRSDDGECEDCHSSCEFCSGAERDQCTKCTKGHFLTAQRTCVSRCPGGFFASLLSGECEACLRGCVQCVDAQRCIRCLNTRKAQLFLQDGQCVQECVRGFPSGQVCRSCAPGCASCGRNASHCLSCQEPLLLHEHQCVRQCPPAHVERERQCHRCPPACQQCSPAGRCTGCEEYHFLHDGLCLLDCPEGFFQDTELRECSPCHPDCSVCDGPNADDCDGCRDTRATLRDGVCLGTCPAHSYRDSATGECRDCHRSCLSCSGPHVGSCTSCRDGRKLDGASRCVPAADACTPHQYEGEDGECRPCHKYCLRCAGPSKSECLSCTQSHLLLNGTCVAECPPGHHHDDSALRCEPCHPSCRSCVGAKSHECLACKSHLFREGKECVEACQHSYYGNTDSRTCERCDPSCSECVGGSEDECLSCAAGLLYLRKEGRCLPSCPRGYHGDAEHETCEPCHASCRTCSAKGARSCDSCHSGYFLSDGMCESVCSEGQYPVLKRSGHSCEDCHTSCLECQGPGLANCTVCPSQAILEARGRCLLCCQHGNEEEEESAKLLQDCCNCTETRGECVLTTNLAFRNEEEEEVRGNLAVFVTACILLVLGLVAVVFLVRHSRSKREPSDIPPRGYEKLRSGGGYGGGTGYSSASSESYSGHASSSSRRSQEGRLVDIGESRLGRIDDDEDEDDDEDIVYMGQDGTVYRKFRYGQLGDDKEDELEYDDESYTFR